MENNNKNRTDIDRKRAEDRRNKKNRLSVDRNRDRAERKEKTKKLIQTENNPIKKRYLNRKVEQVFKDNDVFKDKVSEDFKDKIEDEEIVENGESFAKKSKLKKDDDDFGVGTEKKHKESKAEKLNDLVNDGKDVFGAVSQTNTKDEIKNLAKSVATINPFRISSVKNGVDNAVNDGVKIGLNKTAFGLGTILEKINKRLPIPFLKKTKDGKIDYTANQPMLKIILWTLAIGIFVLFWAIIAVIIFMIIILSASFFAVNDGKVSVGGTGDKGKQESSTSKNNKDIEGIETPKELQGVVVMPVVDHSTSGYGSRYLNGVYEYHYGFDFQKMPKYPSPPVYANIEGTIIAVEKRNVGGQGQAKGNFVVVYNEKYKVAITNQHLDGYGSIPEVAKNMEVGNKVKLSTQLGNQGITGMGGGSTAYHLHIDTYINITPSMTKNFSPYKYYNSKHAVSPSTLLYCPNYKLPTQPGFGQKLPESCKNFAKKARGLK